MPSTKLRQRPGHYLCGLANWHPPWMQRYATTKTFMAVYGLLGTIQAMSYMYFVVTLTTIEKRFKIPSQTTGIILSGNEISQILLSLILSYIGGQRNRPRWIAWGIVFCGLSCYILALPHFIYGAGESVLQLTKEYADQFAENGTNITSLLSMVKPPSANAEQHLCGLSKLENECDTLLTIVPLILIFLSQFVLGVGNTLYYSLGQTYLDDNTKKTNTPLMLAIAMALRMIGPIFGFFLGYVSLDMFIDPTKTPIVDSKDPRWLGAWWFGWTILGSLMILFSGLIGLFPKELPKNYNLIKRSSHLPHVLRHEELQMNEGLPLGRGFASNATLDTLPAGTSEFPKLKDFPKALMRLLRNKLLIYNIIAAIFYILGATGYMTFLSRYMEVQFHKSAHEATIVVGPVSIIGMIIGLVGSGIIISKKKPHPSKVLMWNVIVGAVYMAGQISYIFMYCGDTISLTEHGKLNLTATCNANCSCDGVPYTPVCNEATDTTYFSPCHAGCSEWNSKEKVFSNCACATNTTTPTFSTPLPLLISTIRSSTESTFSTEKHKLLPTVMQHISSTNLPTTYLSPTTLQPPFNAITESILTTSADELTSTSSSASTVELNETAEQANIKRRRRSVVETLSDTLKPGVCLKGCNYAFWAFSITSMIVNWFGSSGRLSNILVNYRAVSTEDKSFAQGLSLMMISLFALIPGPIIFGRIIDSTCLVWSQTCNGKGNCQLYDQTSFRYWVNGMACTLTAIGVIFDVMVWYYGKSLDIYGEREAQRIEEIKRNQPITPLLARK